MTDDKPRLIDLNDPTSNIYKERIKNQNTYIESRLKLTQSNVKQVSKYISGDNEILVSDDIVTDLRSIDAMLNPLLDLELSINRDSVGAPFVFNGLEIDFIPTPELAVIK